MAPMRQGNAPEAPPDLRTINNQLYSMNYGGRNVITSRQMRAARALAGLDQRALAKAAHLSLPTIQRMEASDGVVRGNVESLMKLIAALERLGVELINEGAASAGGGRGVRMKAPAGGRARRSG
jgi:DNA-binding XRE family transcriptional regulator